MRSRVPMSWFHFYTMSYKHTCLIFCTFKAKNHEKQDNYSHILSLQSQRLGTHAYLFCNPDGQSQRPCKQAHLISYSANAKLKIMFNSHSAFFEVCTKFVGNHICHLSGIKVFNCNQNHPKLQYQF